MAATFDDTLPTSRDRLRFMLGDVSVPDGALLTDEAYDARLAATADWRLAGAELAQGLAARFAQEPDSVSIAGEVSVSWRSRVSTWTNLAAAWRAEAAAVLGGSGNVAPEREDGLAPEYSYRPYDPLMGGIGGFYG